jgi:anti-sigma factor RsiW
MSQLSDELLLAYLDGQLGTPQAQSVERMIGGSDDLRARAERLKASQGYLIQTFETLARRTRTAQAPERPAPAQRPVGGRSTQAKAAGPRVPGMELHTEDRASQDGRPRRSLARMVLWASILSVLAAVIGYGAGKWMRLNSDPAVEKIDARVPAPANQWAADVARLHSHFTTASVAADPESQANRDLVELQLSRILNKPVKLPSFPDHALTFRRGQVLSYRGSRMMQLSYASADSGLVSLYVMAGGPDSGLSVAGRRKVTSVHWSEDGLRYVIAGKLPETSLRALAAVAMKQMKAE